MAPLRVSEKVSQSDLQQKKSKNQICNLSSTGNQLKYFPWKQMLSIRMIQMSEMKLIVSETSFLKGKLAKQKNVNA
jgi:hypothetical protein